MAHQLITLRSETTKNLRGRVVHFSEVSASLLQRYFLLRRTLSRSAGPLFLSESNRNMGKPLSKWTMNNVIRKIADRVDLNKLTPHSIRHVRLTELARQGWELHEIAEYAGHRDVNTTQLYIHLSGREISEKAARSFGNVRDKMSTLIASERTV